LAKSDCAAHLGLEHYVYRSLVRLLVVLYCSTLFLSVGTNSLTDDNKYGIGIQETSSPSCTWCKVVDCNRIQAKRQETSRLGILLFITRQCQTAVIFYIYMYVGEMESMGLIFALKLALHPSTFVCLSKSSSDVVPVQGGTFCDIRLS
jgi:hypothetical protein